MICSLGAPGPAPVVVRNCILQAEAATVSMTVIAQCRQLMA
jgi:hypothetical protein